MILPFCKAYRSPVRELAESIRHWPWCPKGAATPHGGGPAQTPADG